MEEILKQILVKFDKLESKVEDFHALIPKINESHEWLSALVENKDVQKAEMNNINHKVAAVEGVLQGFDNSLEVLKKAQ